MVEGHEGVHAKFSLVGVLFPNQSIRNLRVVRVIGIFFPTACRFFHFFLLPFVSFFFSVPLQALGGVAKRNT